MQNDSFRILEDNIIFLVMFFLKEKYRLFRASRQNLRYRQRDLIRHDNIKSPLVLINSLLSLDLANYQLS